MLAALTAITALLAIWGVFEKYLRDGAESSSSAASQAMEVVQKTPADLVKWYSSIPDEFEARKQAKVLYIRKAIVVRGKPEIYAVHQRSAYFRLDDVNASIDVDKLSGKPLSRFDVMSFTCRIEEFQRTRLMLGECKVDD